MIRGYWTGSATLSHTVKVVTVQRQRIVDPDLTGES